MASKKIRRHIVYSNSNTVKPCYSTPAFDNPVKDHTNFGFKKHFHSYSYIGNKENFGIEHNFDQSLEMRFSCLAV